MVEAWEHPAKDVEARPLAPAVGLARALGHTSTFQGEPDETGNDIAHHQRLEEFHAPRIPLIGQPPVPRAITSFVTEVKGEEHFVHAGEVLPPNHPVVKARPELFEPDVEKSTRRSAK